MRGNNASSITCSSAMVFSPTRHSIPPNNVLLRLRDLRNVPVYYHPLVRFFAPNPRLAITQHTRILSCFCSEPRRSTQTKLLSLIPTSHSPLSTRLQLGKCFSMVRVDGHSARDRTQRVQNLAYALIKFGIKPGDRVAVIAPNWYVPCMYYLSCTDQMWIFSVLL